MFSEESEASLKCLDRCMAMFTHGGTNCNLIKKKKKRKNLKIENIIHIPQNFHWIFLCSFLYFIIITVAGNPLQQCYPILTAVCSLKTKVKLKCLSGKTNVEKVLLEKLLAELALVARD